MKKYSSDCRHDSIGCKECLDCGMSHDNFSLKENKFKVGDHVFDPRYGWMKVTSNIPLVFGKCLEVSKKDGSFKAVYYSDGKEITPFTTYPILLTEEEAAKRYPEFPRPKVNVKKHIVRYVNVHFDNKLSTPQPTEELAKSIAFGDDIAIAVPFTGEYEVEE